jgi:hypothetical protein
VVVIIGMPLPWLKVGGLVLSAQTDNGFEGAAVVTFLAAVAMLALIVLPYTTKSRRVGIDRTASYLGLVVVGIAALGVELIDLVGTEGSSLGPLDAPGLWLGLAGMAIASWGVLELIAERPLAS